MFKNVSIPSDHSVIIGFCDISCASVRVVLSLKKDVVNETKIEAFNASPLFTTRNEQASIQVVTLKNKVSIIICN